MHNQTEQTQGNEAAPAPEQDIFAKAMLYIYQARLEKLGLKGDLRAVRVVKEVSG